MKISEKAVILGRFLQSAYEKLILEFCGAIRFQVTFRSSQKLSSKTWRV